MLLGTAGVVIGAPLAYLAVKHGLGPEMWKAFGTLAGSWIGGTGNMNAVAVALELDEEAIGFSYALMTDQAVYLVWLPILLASKNFAHRFNRFTGIPPERLGAIEEAAARLTADKGRPEMRHYLYLAFLGFGGAALASWIADQIPPITLPITEALADKPFLTAKTYMILLVTCFGVALSFTPARRIPGSHAFSMALVYLFVARMGALADLTDLEDEEIKGIFWFILGGYLWISIHGFFLVAGAKIFKVDVHTAAIASAANIGGAASAPVVAAYHRSSLVPVAILMALLGYAIGNPAAILAGLLCRLLG
jgi:uncharacterized membrane protein